HHLSHETADRGTPSRRERPAAVRPSREVHAGASAPTVSPQSVRGSRRPEPTRPTGLPVPPGHAATAAPDDDGEGCIGEVPGPHEPSHVPATGSAVAEGRLSRHLVPPTASAPAALHLDPHVLQSSRLRPGSGGGVAVHVYRPYRESLRPRGPEDEERPLPG